MNIQKIKEIIKESIIYKFLENTKFNPRGPEKQRPKSWNKGVKSGSERKKSRREGKAASKEMNEGSGGMYDDDDKVSDGYSEGYVKYHLHRQSDGEHIGTVSSDTKYEANRELLKLIKTSQDNGIINGSDWVKTETLGDENVVPKQIRFRPHIGGVD